MSFLILIRVNVMKLEVLKRLTPESAGKYFQGTLNIRMDADMQLGRLEALSSVNVSVVYRKRFLG